MKKNFVIFAALAMTCTANISAQQFVENFDSNSLEWTECTFDNPDNIKSVIANGVITLQSEVCTDIWTGKVSYEPAISTCYAPLDVKKPFKIITHFRYKNDDTPCGILFNLKDEGTYYAIVIVEEDKKVYFQRWEDNELVGSFTQGFSYPKLKKGQFYELILESVGETLALTMQDIPVFKLRYIPTLSYAGFGFLTRGNQEMTIDDVIFEQIR